MLVVDSRRSRLYVFANAQRPAEADRRLLRHPRQERHRQGSPGRPEDPGRRLPRHRATCRARSSTDFYGAGAFPINYPNEWDRRQGRDGYGIWLHGVPRDVYSRPPRASDGCIVLSNPRPRVGGAARAGRPDAGDHRRRDRMERRRRRSRRSARRSPRALEQWRADWQSRDTERYLAHYSSRFRLRGQDLHGVVARTSAR